MSDGAIVIATAAPPSPTWLSKSVMYPLYPQTFADSNADGIVDIPGIIDHLDYLSWLGVNVIWIPPAVARERRSRRGRTASRKRHLPGRMTSSWNLGSHMGELTRRQEVERLAM